MMSRSRFAGSVLVCGGVATAFPTMVGKRLLALAHSEVLPRGAKVVGCSDKLRRPMRSSRLFVTLILLAIPLWSQTTPPAQPAAAVAPAPAAPPVFAPMTLPNATQAGRRVPVRPRLRAEPEE